MTDTGFNPLFSLIMILVGVIIFAVPLILIIAAFKGMHQKLNDKVLRQDSLLLEKNNNHFWFFILLAPFGLLGIWLLYLTPLWEAIDNMSTIVGTLVWMVWGVFSAYLGSSLFLYVKSKITHK